MAVAKIGSNYESLRRFFSPRDMTPERWADLHDLGERCRDVGIGEWRETDRALANIMAPKLFEWFIAKYKITRMRTAGFDDYLRSIKPKGANRFLTISDLRREWVDHGMICYGAGERFFISQPYGLTARATSALVDDCTRNCLEFTIDATLSFHFPGSTLLIEVRRRADGSA
jgi:hypothetical protein